MKGQSPRPPARAKTPSLFLALWKRGTSPFREGLPTLREIARRCRRDRLLFRSAALSYFTLLALLPMAALLLFVASRTAFLARRLDRLEAFLVGQLVTPAARGLAQEVVGSLRNQVALLGSGISGFLALTLLAWMAASLLGAVLRNLREILHARPDPQSSWARVILLGAGLLLPAAAFSASVILEGPAAGFPPSLRFLLPFLLTVTGFYFLYAVLPGLSIGPWAALRAAAGAGLLWEGAKVGLSLYASRVFSSSVVGRLYGSLSLLPVTLFWIYYSWVLVLLGAETAAVLNENAQGPREVRQEGGAGALRTEGDKMPSKRGG